MVLSSWIYVYDRVVYKEPLGGLLCGSGGGDDVIDDVIASHLMTSEWRHDDVNTTTPVQRAS